MSEEKFECGHCGFAYHSREELDKHMDKSHGMSWFEIGAKLTALVAFFGVLIYLLITS